MKQNLLTYKLVEWKTDQWPVDQVWPHIIHSSTTNMDLISMLKTQLIPICLWEEIKYPFLFTLWSWKFAAHSYFTLWLACGKINEYSAKTTNYCNHDEILNQNKHYQKLCREDKMISKWMMYFNLIIYNIYHPLGIFWCEWRMIMVMVMVCII